MMYEDVVGESAGLANVPHCSRLIPFPQCPLGYQYGRKVACTVSFESCPHSVCSLRPTGSGFQCRRNINIAPFGISVRVPGEIKRSWRREVELDPQLCPEEMSREMELG